MPISEKILFSIIIPTYNRATIISRAIQSVVDQSYSNWELIIVDDGSSDNTLEKVESFNDKRIKYYYKINEERSIARNFGIDNASGIYICFLDDDDYYIPEFLEEFYKKITRENCPIGFFMCNDYTEINGKKVPDKTPTKHLNNSPRLLWNLQTSIETLMIHRDILINEKFNDRFIYGEDLHLIIRISLKYPFFLLNQALCVNVFHPDQSTLKKFESNLRKNAINSIEFMEDLILQNESIFEYIPQNEFFDFNNHVIYGFSSAAMKNYDFNSFFELVRMFSFKGSKLKILYYFFSLFGRLSIYYIKSLLK